MKSVDSDLNFVSEEQFLVILFTFFFMLTFIFKVFHFSQIFLETY